MDYGAGGLADPLATLWRRARSPLGVFIGQVDRTTRSRVVHCRSIIGRHRIVTASAALLSLAIATSGNAFGQAGAGGGAGSGSGAAAGAPATGGTPGSAGAGTSGTGAMSAPTNSPYPNASSGPGMSPYPATSPGDPTTSPGTVPTNSPSRTGTNRTMGNCAPGAAATPQPGTPNSTATSTGMRGSTQGGSPGLGCH